MPRLIIRLCLTLALVLALAPAASAEVWTAARWLETSGTLSSPNQFDTTLSFVSPGWATVNIYMYDETGAAYVCNPCTRTFNRYDRVRLHDYIQAAGAWPATGFPSGHLRITASIPLSSLNVTLFLGNSHSGPFDLGFAIDNGKILP